MLIIPKEILDDIGAHSMETYPEECCGILVGRANGDDHMVTESHRAENVSEELRHERYRIDERKLFEVLKAVRGLHEDVIGFYHSHPGSASLPSRHDAETPAWPGYYYLIVSAEKDRVNSVQAWVAPNGGESFVEKPIST